MPRKIIPYNPALKELARQLRNNSTQSEIKLWLVLRNKQLLGYDFDRQKPLGNYIADFFCYDLMLAIELDGISHIHMEDVIRKDEEKQTWLQEQGITVLRFWDKEVMNDMPNVLRAIEHYIEQYKANER
ncbi:endonuclease domain-containing protein [Chitinophagaceae bacterium MMS25-I14]